MWHSRPPRDPPPLSFMANIILNFHFDYRHTSLKTLTGEAPRDGREQSHWQEVFRRIDTIYHTSNIALSSIIMSNIRFENFCSSCRTCPLNFRPVDPQNKSDLCCENRKKINMFSFKFLVFILVAACQNSNSA